MDSDISDPKTRLSLLNSLCGQLLSSRMTYVNQKSNSNESMTISMTESQTARDLKTILITLGMGRPPNDVNPEILFKKIKEKLTERLSQQNLTIEDSLLLPEGLTLSPEQWKCLETINEELKGDYSQRREMLLRRCDCTVNSFTWKSDTDRNELISKINAAIHEKRTKLKNTPDITLANALAARQSDCDLLLNSVVSRNPTNCVIQIPDQKGNANKGIQQRIQMEELHKYRIGSVPDRGGRPNEQPKPPKESFSQQQFQRDNPQRGRGGRGGGGGGRGGGPPNLPQDTSRIQGSGWTQNTGDRYSGDFQRRGQNNDYQQNQRGGQQRYQQRDDYQQRSGNHYQQQQQQQQFQQNWNSSNQYYEQQYDKQSYNNYSDPSYYDNNTQYQQQSRPYGGRGGFGRGGGRRY